MTCAGQDVVPTPNIDGIAERGVRFTNAYCPYPVCLASRSALLTGLYAHHTGAINNNDRLDWRYRTIAHHFAEAGYLTALIGKMHFNDAHNHGFEYYLSINDWLMYLGPNARHYANEIANHQLTDHFFGTLIDDGAGFPDLSDLWDGPSPWVGQVERFSFDRVASALPAEDHLDSFIARESCKFMRRYRDQPFLLVISFMKPHTPFYPPREWAGMYPLEAMDPPPVGDIEQYPEHVQQRIRQMQTIPEQRIRAGRAGYLGNLGFVDTCVGQVCDAVEEMGLWDDTIVVYTSDHGEMFGDHGLYQKFCLFEPSVLVPLIVCQRGRIPQGKVTRALTEYIGLYPTLAELAGLETPGRTTVVDLPGAAQRLDAQSFADVLRDPSRTGPSAAFCEYNLRSDNPQYMIRTPRFKYVLNEGTSNELYDHELDPGEYVNRIEDPGLRSVREALHAQLLAWYDPRSNPYSRDARSARVPLQ